MLLDAICVSVRYDKYGYMNIHTGENFKLSKTRKRRYVSMIKLSR